MKSLLALFTIVSAFMLMSCSNVDQDLSPVGPETSKISAPEESGTYPYLRSFTSIPIESFNVLPITGEIEVVVGDQGWPVDLEHIYVILEYESETYPSAFKMVYLEKPRSVSFQLEGFKTSGLKDVKVYCYVLNPDEWPVQHPYPPQYTFSNYEVQWLAEELGITLILDNSIQYGDTFIEIITTEGSFTTFIDIPRDLKIFIPLNGNPATKSVNLYSITN